VLVARLATSEFLIEAVDTACAAVETSWTQLRGASPPAGVYPVMRQDLAIGLDGPALNALLRQICSFDFAPLLASCGFEAGAIVLTSMIGVGVVAWPRRSARGPMVTLWLDPSFAHYFCTNLLDVGCEVGGVTIEPAGRTGGARV
jgi:sarcosine oxidase subunit gamma